MQRKGRAHEARSWQEMEGTTCEGRRPELTLGDRHLTTQMKGNPCRLRVRRLLAGLAWEKFCGRNDTAIG